MATDLSLRSLHRCGQERSAADQKKSGPRLVDTRVADVYAATKPHERPKFPYPKTKDELNRAFSSGSSETSRALRKHFMEKPASVPVDKDAVPSSDGKSLEIANECQPTESAPFAKFREVTQLSSMARPHAPGTAVDMAEALKVMAPGAVKCLIGGTMGLASAVPDPDSQSPMADTSLEKLKTPPVDFSLKVAARFLSVDSLHWCHRTNSANEVEGVKLFVEKLRWTDEDDAGSHPEVSGEKGILDRFGARFCQALHSWVHPPPQYLELYDIALATARGDTKKCQMIPALYRMWEDSFRSLYYMFRHKCCNLFYFCTQQFVVMFVQGKSGDNAFNAYWTRSTRRLRKILQEQGVEFCMPFCNSEADISTLEDLHELTEFEKLNPGQTRLVDPKTAIDNSSQSLLVFEAGNVHRLFDFLLNYRFLVGSASATDFPVLYSAVEFSKASLFIPEVKCKHVQHSTGNVSKEQSGWNGSMRAAENSAPYMSYSLELKGPPGTYIMPWVIQEVCRVLKKSQKLGFEVSFVTGPLSEALNVAQVILSDDGESHCGKESAVVSKCNMSVVKHLRYTDGLYQATLAGLG